MDDIVYEGRIDGRFRGFDDNAVFKMEDGSYWRQVVFRYWDHEAVSPKVVIRNVDGRLMMTVCGETEQVERVENVEECEIDGLFNGWNGTRVYTLTNGQKWEEIGYTYRYGRMDSPEAFIIRCGEATRMYVNGMPARVEPAQETSPEDA